VLHQEHKGDSKETFKKREIQLILAQEFLFRNVYFPVWRKIKKRTKQNVAMKKKGK